MIYRQLWILIISHLIQINLGQAQNIWTQKSSLPGPGRFDAAVFVIGSKAYVSCGDTLNTGIDYLNDLWEWDQLTDTWTQKADFAGSPRRNAIGFSIGNVGFIGGGFTNFIDFQDFWGYSPINNSWNQKNNLPGVLQDRTLGFSIGQYGYAVFSGGGPSLHKYDPSIDLWTFVNTTPFQSRYGGTSFIIGTNAYVGTGGWEKDMWQFNSISEVWMQVADFPGAKRHGTASFSIGNLGYVGLGFDTLGYAHSDFQSYDESSNTWNSIANYPAGYLTEAVGFSINGKGYVCTGTPPFPPPLNYLWEYSPLVGIDEVNCNKVVLISPNPFTDELFFTRNYSLKSIKVTLYNIKCHKLLEIDLNADNKILNTANLPSGIYLYRMIENNVKVVQSGKLLKM